MASRVTTLSAVLQSGQATEEAVQNGAVDRSARIAEALQYLGPFPLYACLLLTPGKPDLAVLDDSGSPRPDWVPALNDLLRGWALQNPDEPAAAPPAPLPGECLCGAAVVFQGRRYGVLALAVPRTAADDMHAALKLVASRLAAQLHFAGDGDEAERLEWLGNIAETTAIVTHEFNNFLNGIMLHLALLKQEAPKTMWDGVDVMKRLVTDAAGLVKKLQEFNGRRRPTLTPTDLNEAVRDALERAPRSAGIAAITCDLAEDLPLVEGARRELARLLELLLRQAGAAMQNKPGSITIRTQSAPRKIVLRFEDAGPGLAADVLAKVFEPFFLARPGIDQPGLALCHTLARRLHAGIRAENRPDGGVAFVLEFTPAAAPR